MPNGCLKLLFDIGKVKSLSLSHLDKPIIAVMYTLSREVNCYGKGIVAVGKTKDKGG